MNTAQILLLLFR